MKLLLQHTLGNQSCKLAGISLGENASRNSLALPPCHALIGLVIMGSVALEGINHIVDSSGSGQDVHAFFHGFHVHRIMEISCSAHIWLGTLHIPTKFI
jgi:hypothetical protein